MVQGQRFNILINKDSGAVRRLGTEGVETVISASPINIKSLIFAKGNEIGERFEKLRSSEYPVLLGGGDGTIAYAVRYFQPAQKPFGILPMGTMNLMAGDLGIPVQLDAALTGYAKGIREIHVDMAEVNGHPFLCCAALGVMPKASIFRESKRHHPDAILLPQLTIFVLKCLERTHRQKLKVEMDGQKYRFKTAAFLVSNNQYAAEGEGDVAGAMRDKLNTGLLGVYHIAPRNFWERLLLLLHLKTGGWTIDPYVREYTAREVKISSHHAKEWVSLDGEPMELQMPLQFKMYPGQLPLIIPHLLPDPTRV